MIDDYNKAEPVAFRFIMRIIAMRIRMTGLHRLRLSSREMGEFYREMGS